MSPVPGSQRRCLRVPHGNWDGPSRSHHPRTHAAGPHPAPPQGTPRVPGARSGPGAAARSHRSAAAPEPRPARTTCPRPGKAEAERGCRVPALGAAGPARPAPLPARGQHPLGHPCPPRGLPGPAPPCRVSLPPLPRPGCCGQARAAPAALPSQPTPIVRAGFSQSFLSSPLSFSPAPSILSRRCWEETQDPCTPSLPGQSLAGKGSSWHIPLSGAQHRSFTLCEGTG